MKRLLLPALFVPSVAMAGLVVVDDGSTATQMSGVPQRSVALAASSGPSTGSVGAPDVAVPVAASAVVAAPAVAVPVWTLRRGRLVSHELAEIGAHSDWHVTWLYPREIVVPADTTYAGDFEQVATQAITTLKKNGLLINAKFWEGNKTLVVRGAGTTPQ